MIGWRDFLGADFDTKPKAVGGVYYCGCEYVQGQDECQHHGDPIERWPQPVPRGDDDGRTT